MLKFPGNHLEKSDMQQELWTVFMGALPVSEIRGAIPLGVGVFGFSLPKAYLLGALGNMLPVIPFLFFLKKFSEFLMKRWYFFNRFMTWLFERFQRKHQDHFHNWNWSLLALFVFVAIPFPLTGAWSGMIASHVLGISFWRSVGAIFLGILTSGAAVSLLLAFGIMAAKNVG